MMNQRERRDMEEYRAYYEKVQRAIETMQQEMNKIDLHECAKCSDAALVGGVTARTIYMQCIKLLTD